MAPVLPPNLGRLNWLVELSHDIEKAAEAYPGDKEVLVKAAEAKLVVDAEVFSLLKTANIWSDIKKPALWGLGVGIPAAAAGTHLINKFYDRGEEATADVRNKILQTALGVAGVGAGLYGLHRLTGGAPLGGYPPAAPAAEKTSSADDLPEDVIEKLATVGAIEELLSQLPGTLPEDEAKLAAEIRVLNRGYGMHLLYEIGHE